MFNDNNGITGVDKPVKNIYKPVYIGGMESGSRLIQDISVLPVARLEARKPA